MLYLAAHSIEVNPVADESGDGKREHPIHKATRERDEALARVKELEARLASQGQGGPAAPTDDPASPREFFMHLVVGISAHQGMTAFDPNAQAGLLANGALAYDTYTRLVRDHEAVLAKARQSLAIRAKQDADRLAEIEAKRKEREEHRARLSNMKGGATMSRLMSRGHSAEEARALASMAAGGLPAPESND